MVSSLGYAFWRKHQQPVKRVHDEVHERDLVAGPQLNPTSNDVDKKMTTEPLPSHSNEPKAVPISHAIISTNIAKATFPNQNESNTLVWEAEWANHTTGTWECLPGQDVSGEVALWSREDTGRKLQRWRPQAGVQKPGIAYYHFNVPNAGRYRLFLRIWASDHCGNSCWVNVNRRGLRHFPDHGGGTQWDETMFKRWLWLEGSGAPVYQLNAGENKLELHVREDGFGIDQIAFVPVNEKTPRGMINPTIAPTIPDESDKIQAKLFLADKIIDPNKHNQGWVYLRRQNKNTKLVEVNLSSEHLIFPDGHEIKIEFEKNNPIALIPFSFKAKETCPRQSHPLQATINWSSQEKTISQTVTRPFAWYAVEINQEDLAAATKLLIQGNEIDFDKPLLKNKPESKWIPIEPANHYTPIGSMDLSKALGDKEFTTAFIATKFEVQKDHQARLTAGGDDTLILRLNGKTIYREETSSPLADSMKTEGIQLKAGPQILIGKVTQRSRFWFAHIDFKDNQGKPNNLITGTPPSKN